MFLLELSDEVDAQIDPVRFKVEEIESATVTRGFQLSSEIDKLRKCSANLPGPNAVLAMPSSSVVNKLSARPLDCGGTGRSAGHERK